MSKAQHALRRRPRHVVFLRRDPEVSQSQVSDVEYEADDNAQTGTRETSSEEISKEDGDERVKRIMAEVENAEEAASCG